LSVVYEDGVYLVFNWRLPESSRKRR